MGELDLQTSSLAPRSSINPDDPASSQAKNQTRALLNAQALHLDTIEVRVN